MGRHPQHSFCNQAWVFPKLRAVYVENQKAASRSILDVFMSLDSKGRQKAFYVPYTGYPSNQCAQELPRALFNFTVFTFVRRPLECFSSGYAETMGRVVADPTKARWGGRGAPDYYALPCNASDRYLTTFVADVLAKRPLGWPTFHIFPQAVKVGVHLGFEKGFDFIGMVEHLEEHLGMLLKRLHVPHATNTVQRSLQHLNRATGNQDRCHQIRPTPHRL